MDNCIKASDKAPDEETLRGQNLIVRRQLLDDCIEASDKAPDDKITTETPITGAEDSCLSRIKDQIPNAKIAEHEAQREEKTERYWSYSNQSSCPLKPMKLGNEVIAQNPLTKHWDTETTIISRQRETRSIPDPPDAVEPIPAQPTTTWRYPKRVSNHRKTDTDQY